MSKMATIKDVAKLAGVSISTVSRTVADSPLVDEQTKQSVRSAIDMLDYVPNQIARNLKSGKSHTIELIIPSIINPYFPKLVNCVEKYLQEYEYALLLGVTNYSAQQEVRCIEQAKKYCVDGIFLVSSAVDFKHIRELSDGKAPIVLVNRVSDVGFSCVTNDNKQGSYRVIEYLVRRGHKRFACIARNTQIQHFHQRYEGCIQAFAEYNIPLSQVTFSDADNVNETYAATAALLAEDPRPTAFFVFSDELAPGVYSAAHSRGLSIPDDVSVMGFDDIDNAKFMLPALSTYQHPVEEIAREAVERIMEQIEKKKSKRERSVIIEGKIMERESVRDMRANV